MKNYAILRANNGKEVILENSIHKEEMIQQAKELASKYEGTFFVMEVIKAFEGD
ncbi:hypothetical protein ACRHK7_00410 [Weissella tructae]|uniref:hypothetical protein n=1 Tax=Weissella tructae TaxID=887702 RepID=UPI003D90F67E